MTGRQIMARSPAPPRSITIDRVVFTCHNSLRHFVGNPPCQIGTGSVDRRFCGPRLFGLDGVKK